MDFPELFFHKKKSMIETESSGFGPIREKAFGAARRLQQTQNENKPSAEDCQSAAEAIFNQNFSFSPIRATINMNFEL